MWSTFLFCHKYETDKAEFAYFTSLTFDLYFDNTNIYGTFWNINNKCLIDNQIMPQW